MMYHLLESVGTKPNVMYQTKVRNTRYKKLEINRVWPRITKHLLENP